MRPTRVIYVENDPALRGILGSMLAAHPALELVLSAGSADEVLGDPRVDDADVALLDLVLGQDQMNGIDLGIALRQRHDELGIVIHSQHEPAHVIRRLPIDDTMGWSFIPKTGDMRIDDVVAVLRGTARGRSTGAERPESRPEGSSLANLTDRQRAVMALAADGFSAPEIARRLGGTHDSVRQDLSRAYRVLVPQVNEGEDRRTRAVVAYLQLVREESWSQS